MKISIAVAYKMSALPIPFGNAKQIGKDSEPRKTEPAGRPHLPRRAASDSTDDGKRG